MARTRISIAKSDIVALLNARSHPVLRYTELARIFADNRVSWRLPMSMRLEEFIEYLRKNSKLRRVRVEFPHRPETLFTWGDVSSLCVACAVRQKAYLSHYTAMHLYELTDQVPEILYVNNEQRPQPKPIQAPTQETINRAFRGKQRMSKNIASLGRQKICLLNGKHTGQLGIVSMTDSNGCPLRVTGLERTLIDIVVRPAYSGGVGQVLEAYRRAAEGVQVNRLIGILRKLEFAYPYQQAIGFYMERSGAYEDRRLELLERGGFDLDFYLTYGMKDKDYSARWRLFYPSGL